MCIVNLCTRLEWRDVTQVSLGRHASVMALLGRMCAGFEIIQTCVEFCVLAVVL